MRRALGWLALATLLATASLPSSAVAQTPASDSLYAFALEVPEAQVTVGFGQSVAVPFTFRDLSKDGAPNGQAQVPVAALTHSVRFVVEPQVEDAGWYVKRPVGRAMFAGDVLEDELVFQAQASAANPYYIVNFQAIVSTADGSRFVYNSTVVGYSPGVKAFSVLSPPSVSIGPQEVADMPIRVTNSALLPRVFTLEVIDTTCGIQVAGPSLFTVGPKTMSEVVISIESPAAKPYYLGDQCQVQVAIAPQGAADAAIVVTASIQVDGVFVSKVWVFWIVAAILFIVLLVLFIIRRKERIEEELLGKPQKPWTIPVEALYLRALRQKDERAWYVVRHHLMEEEYRSSLLWYKAYKKATKGTRKKEAVVLRHEKSYERWKAKWQKRIATPLKEADRFEAKLQRKLDRKARKLDRKEERSVRKLTKKMAAAHAKQVERALEKWQKQVRKAEKKGLAAPERPVVPEPDYPDESEPRSFPLAEHKWSKKAARFRARRVKEQGNLEVKFEKADARHLAKLRRKVQRLARKLDDPDFVAEHPLLRPEA